MTDANYTTGNTQGAGSSVGNKVKGVFEVVHGIGENIRGTALGAIDTMGHSGYTKNDEIARQGRLETERGMQKLKGGGSAPMSSYAGSTTAAGNASVPDTYSNATSNTMPSGADTATGLSSGAAGVAHDSRQHAAANQGYTGSQTEHPSHHRDDAITGLPRKELQEIQAAGEPQPSSMGGNGYNQPSVQAAGGYEQPPPLPPRSYGNTSAANEYSQPETGFQTQAGFGHQTSAEENGMNPQRHHPIDSKTGSAPFQSNNDSTAYPLTGDFQQPTSTGPVLPSRN